MLSFLGVNLFIGLLVALYLGRKDRGITIIKFLIMVFLPVVGELLFIALYICRRLGNNYENKQMLGENKDNKYHIKLLPMNSDSSREMNLIPIEDALILNDNTTKRRLMIDALKGDTYKYIGFLKKALKDTDTETAHYAATAVMELKRKMMLEIQQHENKYEMLKTNVDFLISYADALKRYIESDFLDERSIEKYMNIYSMLLASIIRNESSDEFYYSEKINCDIKLKNYDEAISYCLKYKEKFEQSDKPYILLLKIYFINRDQVWFNKTLLELKRLNIKLQPDSLRIMRFWLEGA